jgi:signal transduction histidine kinase
LIPLVGHLRKTAPWVTAALLAAFAAPASARTVIPDIRDSYGVAVADFDGDGLLDVYLVGFRTLNRLLINNGDGSFRDKSIPAGVGGNLMPQGIRNLELGAGAVDFDNDGAVDLLICGWGEALDLLKNRGDGTFYTVTKRAGLARDVDANMAVWGDLDNDGYLDLLLTNEQGPVKLYRNDHGLHFIPVPLDSAGIAADSGSQGALWCDLDLDGDLDLVLAGWHHPLRVYEQVSPFHFKEVKLDVPLPEGMRCNAILAGDVDNDGDADLLVTVRSGPNLLLINQADPPRFARNPGDWRPTAPGAAPKPIRFTEESRQRGLFDALDSYGGALSDFDGDGDADLFLTTRDLNHYYRNEGGFFREVDLEDAGIEDPESSYNTGFVTGDLTPAPGDEMAIASRDSASSIRSGPPPKRRRLQVALRGVHANPGGVGAWIGLWALPKSAAAKTDTFALAQSRQVFGGQGYLSSYVGPESFYLPDSALLRVTVRFPGGRMVVRKIEEGDTLAVIREGSYMAAVWARSARTAYTYFRDPQRRKNLLFSALAIVTCVILLRASLKAWAQNIARKRYARELVDKNRELQNLIEEVNRTQQQLIRSEKLAALGQLVAGIAHELNNPIGFIYANLYQIRKYIDALDRLPLDESAKASLRKIDQALRDSQDGSIRIRDIVQNLRGLSRAGNAEPGRSLRKQPCDINRLLDKTAALASTNFSKNVALEKEYGTLPQVEADETQIQQVFLNILVNAGQALGDKGRIRIRTFAESGNAVVSISDDGPGISEENLKHIFEPFFTTKPVGQGIGLGLHICYQIVAAHGGSLEAKSAGPGQGAEFGIRLPLSH